MSLARLENWLLASTIKSNENLPLVVLSFALSLDGSLAAERGKPTSISCDESLKFVHFIRSFCDAVMVGIGTILSDDPRLSVRLVKGEDPVPIIIDSSLRTPPGAKILTSSRQAIIFCGIHPDQDRKQRLENAGALILESKVSDDGLFLPAVLENIYKRGLRSLMVEGGAGILRSFFSSGLWNKMAVTVNPSFLGGYNLFSSGALSSPVRAGTSSWMEAGTDQICLMDKELL